ncbi:hypothetical protein [Noviherbaspirillum galbum]|uniref:Replication protein n=1 Tax=Noviherbaspirillum galbum TaxID=2709383 RepID=A0A6B3SSN6_9BURK|nr:hypothetical protein [Noviherbaspirillum galbum]NEX60629.1 hypothetical protein [Noviherbaspirillum galbum]
MGRLRTKRKVVGRFLLMPHRVLHSPQYHALPGNAVKLLLDIAAQYNGKNNGDLSIAWKIMQPKGWKSEATLNKAKKELLASGFIAETRKGRLPNLCSLYGITWQPLDHDPKYDIGPLGFPMYAWETTSVPRLKMPKAAATSTTASTVIQPG